MYGNPQKMAAGNAESKASEVTGEGGFEVQARVFCRTVYGDATAVSARSPYLVLSV